MKKELYYNSFFNVFLICEYHGNLNKGDRSAMNPVNLSPRWWLGPPAHILRSVTLETVSASAVVKWCFAVLLTTVIHLLRVTTPIIV